MFCEKCGAPRKGGTAFCERCGAPARLPAPQAPAVAPVQRAPPTAAPAPYVPGFPPPVLGPPSGAAAAGKKRMIALVAVLAVVGAGAGAIVLMGGLGGSGQCVFQQTDFSGHTTTSRYDGYTQGECDQYCADHPGHPCWWEEY
jgi:hypothetical protein